MVANPFERAGVWPFIKCQQNRAVNMAIKSRLTWPCCPKTKKSSWFAFLIEEPYTSVSVQTQDTQMFKLSGPPELFHQARASRCEEYF